MLNLHMDMKLTGSFHRQGGGKTIEPSLEQNLLAFIQIRIILRCYQLSTNLQNSSKAMKTVEYSKQCMVFHGDIPFFFAYSLFSYSNKVISKNCYIEQINLWIARVLDFSLYIRNVSCCQKKILIFFHGNILYIHSMCM